MLRMTERKISALIKVLLLFLLVSAQRSDECRVDQALKDVASRAVQKTVRTKVAMGGSSDVYVASVSFVDGITKTGFLSHEGELIDKAVQDGLARAAKDEFGLKINESGHSVPDVASSVITLADIYFNPRMTNDDKFPGSSRNCWIRMVLTS